jgi:N-acetylmuramoyl-L-alanine amidase
MGLPDRGVCPDTKIHRTGFYILRKAVPPAVLIEAGFVSHAPTALQLSRPEFRQRAAQGIVAGLRKYWNRIHGGKLTRR